MGTFKQSEDKALRKAKIVMVIATIILIVLLFTPLWKSNVAATSIISKVFGIISFSIAFSCIAIESWLRVRAAEWIFYVGWFVAVLLGLLLMMGGGL